MGGMAVCCIARGDEQSAKDPAASSSKSVEPEPVSARSWSFSVGNCEDIKDHPAAEMISELQNQLRQAVRERDQLKNQLKIAAACRKV